MSFLEGNKLNNDNPGLAGSFLRFLSDILRNDGIYAKLL